MTRTCKDCPAILPPSPSPQGGRPRERCDACQGAHARLLARRRQARRLAARKDKP